MRILILSPYYLPGYKAGGPIRSISNLVARLGDEFRFHVITRDRDLGDAEPYPELRSQAWQRVGKAQVAYLPPSAWPARQIASRIRDVAPDVLYVNSLYDVRAGTIPLMLWRAGAVPRVPLVIAPRGQFGRGARSKKWWKKTPYLAAARILFSRQAVLWHATGDSEREDIRRTFGRNARIVVAPNLCVPPPAERSAREPKQPGRLRLVYLARVSPMKNLAGAIDMLRHVAGRISLDIWGPLEDAAYWRRCQQAIEQLPSHAQVAFRGPVAADRVTSTLANYDALLLPTHGENFGHAIIEALAAGCPAVISDRTPWRNLESAGVGWDLPLKHESAFHLALSSLAAMDEPAHRRLRERAAAFGRQMMLCREHAEMTRQLFRRAIAEQEGFSPRREMAA